MVGVTGLVVVPKFRGGVRPIAIGEILPPFPAKCLLAQVRSAAREHLFPAQVGVVVPVGKGISARAVRTWLGRYEASHFSALARWVAWCYRSSADLRFGNRHRLAAGVQ